MRHGAQVPVHEACGGSRRARAMRALVSTVCGIAVIAGAASPVPAQATRQGTVASPRLRTAYLDSAGVIRWRDDGQEVALFGANYVLPTASDYRAAGYVHGNRKKMIDDDMAHFARMGWDGMRLTFWGDWEASDSAGNLIANDHLDLQDYLIARARERGIYMLFSPIQLYDSNWPDALDQPAPGFGRKFGKGRMGTDSMAIEAQVNYLRQILNHVNPYTGVALKNEPAILFLELVNEPWHHPEDLSGSVTYINALTDAVRSTGCTKLIFYNVSQDFRIADAIRRSRAQGVTFGWYPSGLNSGHELQGNFLRAVDAYPDMLRPEMAGMPRIVYEFDSPDLRTGTMYPATARTFRSVGTQFAAMFAYDMLGTASRNLGWQTHNLNLVYTPRMAMSAIIAAEAMRRLPRMQSYGSYPENTRFGDFHVDAAENLGELVARDAFLYAGSTSATPPDVAALKRIAGYGSSSAVRYEGEGIYFLDKVRDGLWRLEVYPDAVPVSDPFEPPNVAKVVTRVIHRSWPMVVTLPDLGNAFTVQPVAQGNASVTRASQGRFAVTPGVYVLSAHGRVAATSLPSTVGSLGFNEYHAPPTDTLAPTVQSLAASDYVSGRDAEITARVVDDPPADSVVVFFRPVGGMFERARMRAAASYLFSAALPTSASTTRPQSGPRALGFGPHEFAVTLFRNGTAVTFPGAHSGTPVDWNFNARDTWTFNVVHAETPLTLFDPGVDVPRLAFTRIGDAGRRGLFGVRLSDSSARPVFHFELPVDASGWSPPDYTSSLFIGERIVSRRETVEDETSLSLRLRGLGARQTVHVTLMEDDGTSWTAAVPLDSAWRDVSIPLSSLGVGRGVLLPEGFPGEWNYWVGPASGRGSTSDHVRIDHLERIQFSLRREDGVRVVAGTYGVEIERVMLRR